MNIGVYFERIMQKLSHREIQLYLLDILKAVDSFCVKEGIRYSMAYGTLLGRCVTKASSLGMMT